MTKKAYYDEPFIKEFTARVTSNIREGELSRVGLERTYFYPDSGGQPHDTGKMDGHDVVNVIVDGGEIYHLVDGDIGDGEVACRIDWDRRMDHMQQHTGQHILSQAIFKVIGKGSESLHIGRETSSIDIESGDIAPSQIDEIERVANGAVMEDLPIETYIVDSTKGLDLRKETCLDGDIRIVDIKGYDMTPCGGTHLDRTGKVGPIKILKWYRKGRYQRIEFVCGWRCIKTMQTNGTALQSLGNMLMVPVGEVYGKVEGIEEERRELIRRTKALEES
ncbi:MAG TPA: alanyl-tRNA editing protein, partial [Candidatus Methanofastidiosa archaeon]|nr:alanyl-tRNA editing protein [Candidatus Methanofastidiosa archaeon]